jgi:hypothetical protein
LFLRRTTKIIPMDPNVGGTIRIRIPLFKASIIRTPAEAA